MTIEIEGLEKQDARLIKSKGFTVDGMMPYYDNYNMVLSHIGFHTDENGSSILIKDLKGGDAVILLPTDYHKITIY